MTTRAPREEITLPRQVVLDLVKQVSKRRPKTDNPALNDAILTIADVGAKQGYRAARWLVDARAIWLLAHVTDVRALYEPGEKLDVALIVQNGVREALERDAPTTCRAMRKLVELGEITLDQPTTIEPGHTGAHTTTRVCATTRTADATPTRLDVPAATAGPATSGNSSR